MFTGLIQTVGVLERRTKAGGGVRVTIATPKPLPDLALGESIAVNGACLTVASQKGRRFTMDVSPETLRCTTLGELREGAHVNLERALRMGDRLGGHLVLGHVDAVGRLLEIQPEGAWVLYRFRTPRPLAPYLVEKGSIAVDGVSLTIFACRSNEFTVALIPHTLSRTTLDTLEPGDPVNLEADVLLKHVAAMVKRSRRRR